jgi:hypothetical protein
VDDVGEGRVSCAEEDVGKVGEEDAVGHAEHARDARPPRQPGRVPTPCLRPEA